MCFIQMMSGLQCTGVGSSKKAAKKRAAEQMLELLDESGDGYDQVDALVDKISFYFVALLTFCHD